MTQRIDIDVPTPDGRCPSVLVVPDGEGAWPGVIMFMDAGGVRPPLVSVAEDVAAGGYAVLLPEMYYRHGAYQPFVAETAFTDRSELSRMLGMASSVTKAMVASDAGAFLDALSDRPEVSGTRFGTTGYCMGGALALTAAGHHPDRIVAAASFHGGHLATDAPDSPHRVIGRATGRVYIAAAENDPSFPSEQATLLEQALTDGGVDHLIETYPAGHGFAVPDNPTYDPDAAARHLRALHDLFGATLTG